MSGWKSWAAGEEVLATDFQNYVQDQVVQVYAGTAARSSALGTAVTEGMVSYLSDTNALQVYDGSAWTSVGGGGTATYATTAGTAVYATNAGTAVFATTSGTATYATTSGTAVYSTTAGTADYSTTSGTATYATTAGTSVFATNAGTSANLSGTITTGQVTGTTIVLNGTAIPMGGTANVTGGGGTADFSNPMTALGDLIVGGTVGVAERLGIGSANTYLFSNGTVASWNTLGTATYATTAGTATYATTAGTSVYATNAGTSVYATNAGTSVFATNAGTAVYATTSGTAVFATTASTATNLSGTITPSQVSAGTFTTGDFTFGSALTVTGAFTANPGSPTNANAAKAAGYVGLPQVALSSGGTTISAIHAGDHIYNTSAGTVTIPANSSVPLEVGTTVVIINGNNTSTVNITTDTLRQAGTTNTGPRTLAAYGMATLVKVASTTWMISGNGVS